MRLVVSVKQRVESDQQQGQQREANNRVAPDRFGIELLLAGDFLGFDGQRLFVSRRILDPAAEAAG